MTHRGLNSLISLKNKHDHIDDDELEEDDKNDDKIKQAVDKITHIFTGTNISLMFCFENRCSISTAWSLFDSLRRSYN